VTGVATLTGSVSGPLNADDVQENVQRQALGEYYDDTMLGVHSTDEAVNGDAAPKKQSSNSKALMPRTIAASFAVKGWLASGIKVGSLVVDTKRSKGLGDGVKPYKGVKYLTVSKNGVERRIE
jgi:AP-3 complex subunit mu